MPTKSLPKYALITLFICAVLSVVFYYSNALNSVAILFLGALLGATLNYFHFGFSSSFRTLIGQHRTLGMRAIIMMLGIAVLLFFPFLLLGDINGQTYTGLVRPLSLGVIVGAVMFGVGMQIGCGCTSGTLNKLGQLQTLAIPTLLFMIVGGTLASASFEHWRHWPTLPPFAFQTEFDWYTGLSIQLLMLSTAYLLFHWIEKKRHGSAEPLYHQKAPKHLHPFASAAILLAMLNTILFGLTGTPWSIATIFPYWGVQLIELLSIPIDWSFWEYTMENHNQFARGLFANQVSLTTMGVIIGALVVSLIHPRDKVPLSANNMLASAIGGLLMGYGAVLASGCNIGALFSGIASGSLHGWVWFACALIGNYVGLKLRHGLFKLN